MNYTDKFTNTDINIHYIETNDHVTDSLPLVYIPGALGTAEQFIKEMKSLFPRHCISISLRGIGKSDAPLKGYTFEENLLDITSVIKKSELNAYYLMAYSMGVPYAIQYAATNPSEVKGLILCDYPACWRNSKSVELIEFINSGHELWVPDYDKFILSIKDFLNKIEA